MAECTVPYKVVLFVGVIQMCPTQSRLSAFLFCFLENCARTSRGKVHMWVRINTTRGNGRLGAAKLLWVRKGPKLWAIRMSLLNLFIKDRVWFPSNGSSWCSWLWQHLNPICSQQFSYHLWISMVHPSSEPQQFPPCDSTSPSAGFPWDSHGIPQRPSRIGSKVDQALRPCLLAQTWREIKLSFIRSRVFTTKNDKLWNSWPLQLDLLYWLRNKNWQTKTIVYICQLYNYTCIYVICSLHDINDIVRNHRPKPSLISRSAPAGPKSSRAACFVPLDWNRWSETQANGCRIQSTAEDIIRLIFLFWWWNVGMLLVFSLPKSYGVIHIISHNMICQLE